MLLSLIFLLSFCSVWRRVGGDVLVRHV
jgi:hypothetical protein